MTENRNISNLQKYLPVTVLITTGLITKPLVNEWQFMWIFAFAIFFSCKWITLADALNTIPIVNNKKAALYLFAWVGMDARRFFSNNKKHVIQYKIWLETIAKILIGMFLVYVVTEKVYIKHHILGGWVGLAGLGLIIHFGSFHLLALVWNKIGRNVKPIINFPLLSLSLTDFWSNRWNLAYRDLSRNYILRPLAPKIGVGYTTIIVFVVSGLVHELVISFPANGGYGLPTLYFIIQTVGVFIEKSRFGKLLGLDNAIKGRIFALIFVFAPISLLFHNTFIEKVIIPFLHQIGSIGGV
jgi:alginate O-acetyltransferase complex protein AlgI